MCGHLIGPYAWSKNAQSRLKWLASTTDSLATHDVTFASLPINELALGDGPLSEVRRRGHPVKAWQTLFAKRGLVFRRPVLVFEQALVKFASGEPGQGVGEIHRARHLVTGQIGFGKRHESLCHLIASLMPPG